MNENSYVAAKDQATEHSDINDMDLVDQKRMKMNSIKTPTTKLSTEDFISKSSPQRLRKTETTFER